MKKLFLAVLMTVLFAASAHATDKFYSQSGGGAGTSCGSSHSIAQLNSNSDSLGAGDTAHLCSTISTPLAVPVDGSAGNPFTVFFESGAGFSAATLTTGQAFISKTSGNYIVIDGGSTCGHISVFVNTACNGTIQATANGSTPTYPNSNDFYGVHFPTCNHCEVRNLNIINLFVFNSNDTQGGGNAVSIDAGSNNRVHNNIFHDMVTGIFFSLDGTTANEIDHNEGYNCNWDYGGATGGTAASGFLIHDNDGHDWANWDDLSGGGAHHHNGIHVFVTGTGTGVLSGMQLYNNYFHGTTGVATTAQIFVESPGNGNIVVLIFNNIFVSDITPSQWNNGYIGMFGSSISTVTAGVYNNTMYSTTGATQQIGVDPAISVNLTSKNNVLYNTRMGWATGPIAASNNWYYLADPFYGGDTFSQWKTDCSCDSTSSSGTNPNINLSTYVPNAGSGVIGFGVPLTSLSVTALNSDINGNARPSSAAWDGGAVNSGTTPPSGPTVPSSVLPLMSAAPTSLNFSGTVNGSIACQPLTLDDSGVGPLPVSVTSTASWLAVTPASGNTKLPTSVCVKTAGLAAGSLTGNVSVTSGKNPSGLSASNSPLKIPVLLLLSPAAVTTITRTISITIPKSGTAKCTVAVTSSGTVTTSGKCQ